VLGLVALLVLGLGAFGVATYSLYAPSQYQRLDEQLRASVPFASTQLYAKAGMHVEPGGTGPAGSGTGPAGSGTGPTGSGTGPAGSGTSPAGSGTSPAGSGTGPTGSGTGPAGTGPSDPTVGVSTGTGSTSGGTGTARTTGGTGSTSADSTSGGQPGPGGQPLTTPLPPGTFAELLTSTGKVRSSLQYLAASNVRPRLPHPLGNVGTAGRILTTGSTSGIASWQVLVQQAPGVPGDVVVIAIPRGGVNGALHKLLLIDAGVAAGLLALLSAGSWLVLRRGLRPLEEMATTARSIAAGDLSQRVGHEHGPTEITQLGQAIDTMLSDIETAFDERAATEQRLRRFLADASHELRTPLTSIQGFAELFRLGVDHEHIDDATIVRRIEDEALRMGALVEDLLLLARLDLAPEAQRETVDLAVLAADACSDAVAMAADRPVTLDAPEPVQVTGDVNHLRQAIANLVTNAIRHTGAASPIEVAAKRENGTAIISVRDHGVGLDAEALEHVFDRFWQADAARAGTGAGLGLAIVEAIATEHGGTVGAANAEGGGAVFLIRIPTGTTVPAE
jgi:two-component system OmpR family sensor kinase